MGLRPGREGVGWRMVRKGIRNRSREGQGRERVREEVVEQGTVRVGPLIIKSVVEPRATP